MSKRQRTIVSRLVRYEWKYLKTKFNLFDNLLFLTYLIGIIITGLSDTQSFFIGENSPIPNSWKILKNPQIISILSVIILTIPVVLSQIPKIKESQEILEIVKQNVVPGINLALESLLTSIKRKFKIQGNMRISLWVPVRQKFLDWNLQMVCKTKNIPDKELNASFRLDEGVIGYTYLKNKRKYSLEFIDVSNPNKLPSTYVDLQSDNQILINSDIKAVLAVAAFQESSIIGLLAIDTDEISDLPKMENNKLHDMAVDWIVEYSGVVKLLWRMKNHV